MVTIAFSNMTLKDKLTKIFKLIDENGEKELAFEEFEDVVKDIFVLKEERKFSKTIMREWNVLREHVSGHGHELRGQDQTDGFYGRYHHKLY